MVETEKFFPRAYGLESQAEVDQLYDAWAQSYDAEVTENGYESPRRCAEALREFAPSDTKILDIGCGTGLSGLALSLAGFTDITGTDPNPNMLASAKSRGVYQETWQTDITDPFQFVPGKYGAISAIGVIGSGAAPVELLGQALGALAKDGLMVLSFNDHALEIAKFPDAVKGAVSGGIAEQVFSEYGPHLSGINVKSNVYVLKKL